MAFFDPLTESLQFLKRLTPAELKKLAEGRLTDLIAKETQRAKIRVSAIEESYPSAKTREHAQRLIDNKKNLAGMLGGISGVFGLASVPADLLLMAYLQMVLLVEIATVYRIPLKTDRARRELVDLLGYANGVGPFQRSGPKVLGTLAGKLLEKGGLKTVGRAVPIVAAPVTAYLNNRHIQAVGDEAVRFYDGFDKAHQKTKRASGQ
jgi:hypothetical protein